MPPQDAFGPFIERFGVFVGAVASPVTGLAVVLLAVLIARRSHHRLAALAVGALHAVLENAPGTTQAGVAMTCAAGAAGSLVQAWIVWPFVQRGKRLGRRLRSRGSNGSGI